METTFPAPVFEDPIQEAEFWRGAFLHHYGIFEFIVSDLILRASYREEYRNLGKLPFNWPDKLKRLGRILDAHGPQNLFSEECRRLVSQITIIESDRHLLAHGRMRVRDKAGVPFVHFEMYHGGSDGALKENDLPLSDLRYVALELGAATLALSKLVREMIELAYFEPISLEAAEAQERATRLF